VLFYSPPSHISVLEFSSPRGYLNPPSISPSRVVEKLYESKQIVSTVVSVQFIRDSFTSLFTFMI